MDLIVAGVGIIVFFMVLSLVFSTVKGIFKILFMISSLATILMVIAGGMIISDFKDFQKNFPVSEKKLILEEDNKILSALEMNGDMEFPEFFSEEQMEQYSEYLTKREYKMMLGESYKLMIMDTGIIEEMPSDAISIDGSEFTKEFLLEVLRSDNPNSLMQDSGMDLFLDDSVLKASLFTTAFNEIVTDPIYFFTQYKEGNILIYPETPMFKAIRYIPLNMVKSMTNSAISKVEERIPII